MVIKRTREPTVDAARIVLMQHILDECPLSGVSGMAACGGERKDGFGDIWVDKLPLP